MTLKDKDSNQKTKMDDKEWKKFIHPLKKTQWSGKWYQIEDWQSQFPWLLKTELGSIKEPTKLLIQSQGGAALWLVKGSVRHLELYGRVEQNTTLWQAGMNDQSLIINIYVSFRIRVDKYMPTESKNTLP